MRKRCAPACPACLCPPPLRVVVVVVFCFLVFLIDVESVGQKIKQHTIKGKKNELGI